MHPHLVHHKKNGSGMAVPVDDSVIIGDIFIIGGAAAGCFDLDGGGPVSVFCGTCHVGCISLASGWGVSWYWLGVVLVLIWLQPPMQSSCLV